MPNGLMPPFITKFNKQLYEFLQSRPGVPIESLQHATPEIPYALDNERKNEKIHDRSGDRIFVTSATGIAYFRVNSLDGPLYKLRVGSIQIPFETIYLTNAAQAGKQVSIIIGYEAFIEFASANYVMKVLNIADGEINPATEDKQDTLLSQMDLKASELEGAVRDTKIVDETDKVVSAGITYEFLAVTAIGNVLDLFVISPTTNFSVILTINGIDLLDKTYTEYFTISGNLAGITALAQRDNDGVLTGKYLVSLKGIHFKNHISVKVKNDSGSPVTFDNLFCKYKIV